MFAATLAYVVYTLATWENARDVNFRDDAGIAKLSLPCQTVSGRFAEDGDCHLPAI